MLARCSADAQNAASTLGTSVAVPTFSPSATHPGGASAPRFALWASTPVATMWSLHDRATPSRLALVESGARPLLVRWLLPHAPIWPSLPASAPLAAGASGRLSPANVASKTSRPSQRRMLRTPPLGGRRCSQTLTTDATEEERGR